MVMIKIFLNTAFYDYIRISLCILQKIEVSTKNVRRIFEAQSSRRYKNVEPSGKEFTIL